jgi:hypothetical protein
VVVPEREGVRVWKLGWRLLFPFLQFDVQQVRAVANSQCYVYLNTNAGENRGGVGNAAQPSPDIQTLR